MHKMLGFPEKGPHTSPLRQYKYYFGLQVGDMEMLCLTPSSFMTILSAFSHTHTTEKKPFVRGPYSYQGHSGYFFMPELPLAI